MIELSNIFKGRFSNKRISVALLNFIMLFVVTINICLLPKTNAEEIIHPPVANDPKEGLILDILKLALDNSQAPQNFTFREYPSGLTEARAMQLIKDGGLSVMWAGSQKVYEEEMKPIYIPILKGLLGHRIFIIRKGEQPFFDNVNDLQDLSRIPLGQGRFWGDTKILKANNLNVVDPVKYQSLFFMLKGGRFDFFPRAVHEPWSEVSSKVELNLTVEEKLLIIYPFALHFFVNKNNNELFKHIASGFLKSIDTKEFDNLFFSHPIISEALSKAKLNNRRVFRLVNSDISPQLNVNDESLWLDFSSL